MTVLELRQYTMIPGRRDDFVEIFDREFVDAQEALGIEIVGQFRDRDRPDRYVWIRRFPDMAGRAASLDAFYSGPVWHEHKNAANATMTEWHDVLLLRPAAKGADLVVHSSGRAAHGADSSEGGPLVVLVWDVPADGRLDAAAEARRAFPEARAVLVTDPSPNTYPHLPIREEASVVVVVLDRLPSADSAMLLDELAPAQVLRLAPTARSVLRGR